MKTPVAKTLPKLIDTARKQTIKLSEKTFVRTEKANKFLAETGDFFLFISRIFKEAFSRNFEFREFLRQCYLIGYKTLPLVSVTGIIMGLVLTIQSRPVLVNFGAVSMLPGWWSYPLSGKWDR